MAEIPVFFHRFQVGTVSAAGTDVAFAYDPRWLGTAAAFPISVTMPLRAAPYDTAHIAPWLANLLPEEHQLDMLSRTLGVSAADTLALLSAIGGDTAGALSFGAPADPERWSYVPLTAFYDDP
ncbi:HipA N-terminal domain-containing protein, partial [Salipiger sp. P9]|uniref:HipA N-terminal domain-containing protein n=1 Tax=Salipiger pentaromativorans TaxID=2943193 RepID=UPI0021582FCD